MAKRDAAEAVDDGVDDAVDEIGPEGDVVEVQCPSTQTHLVINTQDYTPVVSTHLAPPGDKHTGLYTCSVHPLSPTW